MQDDGIEPKFPVNPSPAIIGRLMEIGPVEPAGMDRAPISWVTIQAWQSTMGKRLRPWEARLLRRLSIDYLTESRAAEDMQRPAPWAPQYRSTEELRAEARALRAVLRAHQ